MAFPDTIVEFPIRRNITASDGSLIAQYQQAIQNGDMALANQIGSRIPYYSQKLITAAYLNSITETVMALERYYLEKYSPSVIVSSSQPPLQEKTDMWFEITGTNT